MHWNIIASVNVISMSRLVPTEWQTPQVLSPPLGTNQGPTDWVPFYPPFENISMQYHTRASSVNDLFLFTTRSILANCQGNPFQHTARAYTSNYRGNPFQHIARAYTSHCRGNPFQHTARAYTSTHKDRSSHHPSVYMLCHNSSSLHCNSLSIPFITFLI